jgi:hypothetical protein
MKYRFKLTEIILFIFIGLAVTGCVKHEVFIFPPEVKTKAVTNIIENSATLNGSVIAYGVATKVSFSYIKDSLTGDKRTIEANPGTVSNSVWADVSADLTGLSAGTTYLYTIYAGYFTPVSGEIEAFATNHPPDQIYRGGIKFYVDNTGEHGLVASPNDQSIGAEWSSGSLILTNSTGTAIGTGQANTTTIVTAIGTGSYAAKVCDDLILNGYDDWFLPSKDELDALYKQRNIVGGFAPSYYWSSSESSASSAWVQSFMNGIQNSSTAKLRNEFNVRAIRAF